VIDPSIALRPDHLLPPDTPFFRGNGAIYLKVPDPDSFVTTGHDDSPGKPARSFRTLDDGNHFDIPEHSPIFPFTRELRMRMTQRMTAVHNHIQRRDAFFGRTRVVPHPPLGPVAVPNPPDMVLRQVAQEMAIWPSFSINDKV